MNVPAETLADARGALSIWFSRSKMWWGIGMTLQVVVAVAAAITAVCGSIAGWVGLMLGSGAVVGAICRWRGDSLRHRADTLLKHVELDDGFGWEIDRKVLSDNLVMAIPLETGARSRGAEQGNFYASSREPGPLRALENLRESAWWTQHLARWMAWFTGIGTIVLLGVTMWGLLAALTIVGPADVIVLSNVLVAVLAVIVATDLVRLPFDYHAMSQDACDFDSLASALLGPGRPTVDQALRLVTDYQLRRALAPQVPDWVWRLRRKRLDAIWSTTRKYC